MVPAASHLCAQAGPGESLMAGLCREIDRLRCRATQVTDQQRATRDPQLFERLRRELLQLAGRRAELQRTVAWLGRREQLRDGLALAFLEELSRRPLVAPGPA